MDRFVSVFRWHAYMKALACALAAGLVLGPQRPALAEGTCSCRSCSNASMMRSVRIQQTSQGHSQSSMKLRSIQLFGNALELAYQAAMRKIRM